VQQEHHHYRGCWGERGKSIFVH